MAIRHNDENANWENVAITQKHGHKLFPPMGDGTNKQEKKMNDNKLLAWRWNIYLYIFLLVTKFLKFMHIITPFPPPLRYRYSISLRLRYLE
jgi:hypothetical protein